MNLAFLNRLYLAHQEHPGCPSPADVSLFFTRLMGALFPDLSGKDFPSIESLQIYFESLHAELIQLLQGVPNQLGKGAELTASTFFDDVEVICEKIEQDVTAMFEGDPAAKSKGEIIRTYPGFYAIAAYRIAHALHILGVKDIPRIITEHAHSRTGIDIHPGAKIGNYFCIDHGTGVVIGETSIIGNRVKIYQGVTLGALSVNKEDAERKRHPTIEDNVVLYAGASILGGETVIGHDSIIGGNVWLTRSVAPNSKVYYQAKMSNEDSNETDVVIFKPR
jgi:serine O-acetyltransferase